MSDLESQIHNDSNRTTWKVASNQIEPIKDPLDSNNE